MTITIKRNEFPKFLQGFGLGGGVASVGLIGVGLREITQDVKMGVACIISGIGCGILFRDTFIAGKNLEEMRDSFFTLS